MKTGGYPSVVPTDIQARWVKPQFYIRANIGQKA
jgi:hypothetical protein